jgi:hypothetical protein
LTRIAFLDPARTFLLPACLISLALGCSACKSSSNPPAADLPAAGDGVGAGDKATGTEAGISNDRYDQELRKARAGQPADLDGDGYAEFVMTKKADGSVHIQIDRNKDGKLEYLVDYDAKGNATGYVDGDSDGTPERTFTIEAGPPVKKVVLEDTDFNGKMDTRITEISDFTAKTLRIILETDPTEKNAFAVVSDSTGMLARSAGCDLTNPANCDPIFGPGCGFPPYASSDPQNKDGGDNTTVAESGSPTVDTNGRCSQQSTKSIVAALKCAKGKLDCMRKTNPGIGSELDSAFAGAKCPLIITCGSKCPGIATTESNSWACESMDDSYMAINMSKWNALSADAQCSYMLHELMHWAGEPGDGDHNDASKGGKDTVYSCGRYCGGCQSGLGKGASGSANVECAQCASTKAAKQACGVKKQIETGKCGLTQGIGVCHSGIGCLMGSCESCTSYVQKYCDDTIFDSSYLCCGGCPASCNGSNDKPCTGTMPPNETTCNSKPPACP